MNILVFGGSGKIATAVAWYLVRRDDVETVGLVHRRRGALRATAASLKAGKFRTHNLDILDRQRTMKLMRAYDVGVIALPHRLSSHRLFDAAVNAGLHSVDMLAEYHRRPDAYEIELRLPPRLTLDRYSDYLQERAIKNNVTFMDGIGFAADLRNITIGEAIRTLDTAEYSRKKRHCEREQQYVCVENPFTALRWRLLLRPGWSKMNSWRSKNTNT